MSESTLSIVKGVTISQPVIGRITMGHTKLTDKGALPVRDDHFGITTLEQNKADRTWVRDPLEEAVLTANAKEGEEGANAKLTAIPVTVAYNDPNLNLNNNYSAFDPKKGRVLCSGNGVRARRCTESGVKEIDCPRPEGCAYGQDNRCKSMSRVYFRIEGSEDELGVHVLRTVSWNSLSSLASRFSQLAGLTGGKIAGMPMMLVLRRKTASASFRDVFYFADLVTRPGQKLVDAIKVAKDYQETLAQAGLSIDKMESNLRAGLANSDFADEIEDVDEWLSDEELVWAASGVSPSVIGSGLEELDKNLQRLVAASQPGSNPEPEQEPEPVPQSNVPHLVVAVPPATGGPDAETAHAQELAI